MVGCQFIRSIYESPLKIRGFLCVNIHFFLHKLYNHPSCLVPIFVHSWHRFSLLRQQLWMLIIIYAFLEIIPKVQSSKAERCRSRQPPSRVSDAESRPMKHISQQYARWLSIKVDTAEFSRPPHALVSTSLHIANYFM